jgi:hypothetical protein
LAQQCWKRRVSIDGTTDERSAQSQQLHQHHEKDIQTAGQRYSTISSVTGIEPQ